ncbi:MAG: hypothetical protein QG553_792 [Patescibacteria group bacterium]|nr:hypothetical protein [Patescibacteria group bacterium]
MVRRQDASTGKIIDDGKLATNTSAKPTVQVKVYSPFQTYYDAPALSVSAVNDTGPFDILPKHHNFITLLNEGDITIRTDREKRTIRIKRGMMHVKADQVIVFLDV